VCKSPATGVKVLLIGWETPEGRVPLKENRPGSMSIEFSREVIKAEGKVSSFSDCKAMRDSLFNTDDHPCCVIDFKDVGTKNALIEKVNELQPHFVVPLGSKVRKMVSAKELESNNRIILELGFPCGTNQSSNVTLLRQNTSLRRLLMRSLA